MGTILFLLAIAVIVAGVVVTKALERKRTARMAAWTFEPINEVDDEIIELDDRDMFLASPPPPPARAFHHHVHAH
ncbi:MAG: hypothetical protein ABJE66_13335 [Deltaproteobacteria bacterium]